MRSATILSNVGGQKAAAYERRMIPVEELLEKERKAQAKVEEAERTAKELELHKVLVTTFLVN